MLNTPSSPSIIHLTWKRNFKLGETTRTDFYQKRVKNNNTLLKKFRVV